MYAHMHARTHAHARTHTRTRTHTHINFLDKSNFKKPVVPGLKNQYIYIASYFIFKLAVSLNQKCNE